MASAPTSWYGDKTAREDWSEPCTALGGSVLGINIRQARQLARAAMCVHTAGRSLTLDLLMNGEDTDPAFRCNREPIFAWCVGLWDSIVPRGVMLRTFHWAISRLEGSSSPWSRVAGPATAVVAALRRIGWSTESAVIWRTHVGAVNTLDKCPKTVAALVDEATRRSLWAGLAARNPSFAGLEAGGFLAPLSRLITSKPTPFWTRRHVRLLAA